MKPASEHVIILGAGPAGLATGHEITRHGGKVTVLERNDFIGGLCRTIESQGYKFDLGGHRWFTKNEELNKWFRDLMGDEIVMVERTSRIFYSGKYFYYPIRFGDIFKKTGPFTIMHAGFAFFWAMFKQAIFKRPIVNMKQAYTSQFGSKLYEMFFRQYTEKVWGLPCDKLSSDWVSQRSKGLSIWTVVREALMKKDKSQVASLIDEFMYPRYGYVRVPERMAEDIVEKGNDVHLEATVTGVIMHADNDYEVIYQKDGQEHSIRGTDVVSTIPLGVLVKILKPGCSDEIRKIASSLVFRDLITVNVMIKKKQVSLDTWLYIQDSDILFGRMHEPKNWSKDMVPDDEHTSLVLECFCTFGDEIWNLTDDEIRERCVSDLVNKLKFIDEDEVEGASIIRTREAYPVYDMQYTKNTQALLNFLESFTHLHISGRGGTFRYNNSDHSIEMGLLLGRKLLGYDIDHMTVNTESTYQEIISVNEPERDSFSLDDKVSGKTESKSE